MIYNPWKFQSPSLYQWKDIAIYLTTNFAYFSVPWEGDFGFGALGGRGNPPDPHYITKFVPLGVPDNQHM